jgi:hypothetical protein
VDWSQPPCSPPPQVLRAVVDAPTICVTFHDTQEHFVVLYLWRLAQRLDEVGEDRVSKHPPRYSWHGLFLLWVQSGMGYSWHGLCLALMILVAGLPHASAWEVYFVGAKMVCRWRA